MTVVVAPYTRGPFVEFRLMLDRSENSKMRTIRSLHDYLLKNPVESRCGPFPAFVVCIHLVDGSRTRRFEQIEQIEEILNYPTCQNRGQKLQQRF